MTNKTLQVENNKIWPSVFPIYRFLTKANIYPAPLGNDLGRFDYPTTLNVSH